MNEKRDKEKKGVDNDAYDGKKESDVEKGNEKDEKWNVKQSCYRICQSISCIWMKRDIERLVAVLRVKSFG